MHRIDGAEIASDAERAETIHRVLGSIAAAVRDALTSGFLPHAGKH